MHAIGGEGCSVDGCGYRTLEKLNMKSHLASKHGIGGEVCEIDGCGYMCASESHMKRHRKSKHGSS